MLGDVAGAMVCVVIHRLFPPLAGGIMYDEGPADEELPVAVGATMKGEDDD